LKQRSVEEKIKLFPITISGTQAKINYAVIPISSVENDILKDYKEFRDRSIIVMGASVTSLSSAAIFAFNKLATSHFWKSKGWKPALVCAFCLLLIFAEQVRKDTVSFKLSDILQFSENEELFKYPQMAMTREDVDTKTFSLEDQIQYFKSHEDELERRIMLLLESDSFFFTSNTEITLKARDIQKFGPRCPLVRVLLSRFVDPC